jgi:hypothetical protein
MWPIEFRIAGNGDDDAAAADVGDGDGIAGNMDLSKNCKGVLPSASGAKKKRAVELWRRREE